MIKGVYCNTIYETRYWYSFGELLYFSDTSHQESEKIYEIVPYEEMTSQETWEDTIDEFCVKYFFPDNDAVHCQISLDLLLYLTGRYYKHYVISSKNKCETFGEINYDQEVQDKKIDFWTKFTTIYNLSKQRYITLLKLYKSEESKLLDGVKTITTGVGRFNDTPQDITDGDEFGDNTHLSNITKSTAEAVSDVDTKMARLDEIQKRYRNLMKDWTDEFAGLFIESENI